MSDSLPSAKAIFLAAIEEPSQEKRLEMIDRACAGNSELRARVEELLGAHQNDSFLERPAAMPDATIEHNSQMAALGSAAIGPARASTEVAGARIGSYKLLQIIGEGGMGAVWMAEQQQPVRRQVALKVIKAGMDSAQVVARFEAERQALALMDHPNIAKVLDGGTTDNGRPFFVMELVRGIPITKYCDDQRLSPRERLELFTQVCQALQHAHQKGIIHRDIKPSNVLVAPYDGRPVVKVIDFGVAKATGQQLTERTMFTEFGAVVGTVEYMSPEQAELNNQDIDTRSDIYSLGVLLYELLTGTPPLTRQQLQQAAFTEMLRLIREKDPPRPSTRLSESKDTLPSVAAQRQMEPAKLPQLVRGELDCIVMKALEKDRNRRYETANALARDVQSYLSDEPVEAQPPSARYRLQKFVRRHRGPVIAATLLGMAIVAGMIGTSWGLVQAGRALRSEAEQRAVAEHERDGAEQARAAATREAEEKEQARALAEQEKEAKEQARVVAESNRQAADQARREAELALYYNRVGLAHQYCLADNAAQSRRILDDCPLDRRGWEWRYLDRMLGADIVTLPGNGQFTSSLQFSRDGKRLAAFANSGDTGVRVWDLTTNKPLTEINQQRQPRSFNAFDMASDGTKIALGERSGVVSLWDASTGKLIRDLAKLPKSGGKLSFSPDGKWLAAARADDRRADRSLPFMGQPWNEDLVVWNVANGEEVFSPKGHGFVCLFSPDGSRLLTFRLNKDFRVSPTTPDTFVTLFETSTWTEIGAGKLGEARSFSFSGDGRRLALAGRDRQRNANLVRIIDPATGDEFGTWALPKPVKDIALDFDGKILATSESMGSPSIDVWDVREQRQIRTLRGHSEWINAVTFSREGRLASCSWDNTVKLWGPAACRQIAELAAASVGQAEQAVFTQGATQLAFAQPNTGVVFMGPIQKITVLDVAASGAKRALPGHQGGTIELQFSHDGTRLISGGRQADVKVWDAKSWSEVCGYRRHDGEISAVAISPDGRIAATAHEPKEITQWRSGKGPHKIIPVTIHVWDAATGAERMKLTGHRHGVYRLAFSPDGKLLASTGSNEVRIWDAETGSPLRELDPKEFKAGTSDVLMFSPTGKRLVTGGKGALQFWEPYSGRSVATIQGHGTRQIDGVAFSLDEARLATASGREVKVWDAQTGQEILTVPVSELNETQGPEVAALGWTADGEGLRAALRDGSVIEWAGPTNRAK